MSVSIRWVFGCLGTWLFRSLGAGVFGCLLVSAMPASAASREVARHVAQGIREHQAGRFDAAAKAFADAEKILPDDPRVAFNRACALSANGQTEEAEELFQRAVLAPDLESPGRERGSRLGRGYFGKRGTVANAGNG